MQKNKLNLHICGIHLLNPYKTVVSHLNTHFLSIQIIIQPVAGGKLGDHLPVAHTCFNLLDLPRYATKDLLKNKLSQAVEYSTGFGLA